MDVVTDTHGLIWYLEDSPRLSPAARNVFDQCDLGKMLIYVPTICIVEIVYLQEKVCPIASLLPRLFAWDCPSSAEITEFNCPRLAPSGDGEPGRPDRCGAPVRAGFLA
jgi:hypothetical protein